MAKDEELNVFPSHLDSNIIVVIVYPGTKKYESLRSQFQKSGHAFIIHPIKTIVIDGSVVNEPWFTMDHLMVIQAHEIAHFRAGHAILDYDEESVNIEKEADWLGHKILHHHDNPSAAALHKEEYILRYDSSPDGDVVLEEKLRKFVY